MENKEENTTPVAPNTPVEKKAEAKKEKPPVEKKAEAKEKPPVERPTPPERTEKSKKEVVKKETSNQWPLVALIVGVLIAAAIYFKPVPQQSSPSTTPVVDASELNREKMKKASPQVAEVEETPPPAPVVEKIRLVAPGPGHVGEPPPPPVVRWIRKGGYLVPVRQMLDGVAGYGESYTRPPTSGQAPQEDWAKAVVKRGGTSGWARNERGDWAIPLR